jgi:hypothetical protein
MTLSTGAQQIEDFFTGGVPAVKFPDGAYGTVIGGEITADPRMQQQRDYTTGDPICYPDGNPAMQMVIVVQTGQHDPGIEGDDGNRALYVKGQMKQAVGEALRKHGEKAPRRGGKLWLKYLEDKPVTLKNGRPGNPQKIYAAKYEPPAQAAASQFFDDPAVDPRTTYLTNPPGHGGSTVPVSADSMRSTAIAADAVAPPPGIPAPAWQAMTPEQRQQMREALAGASAAGSGFAEEAPF